MHIHTHLHTHQHKLTHRQAYYNSMMLTHSQCEFQDERSSVHASATHFTHTAALNTAHMLQLRHTQRYVVSCSTAMGKLLAVAQRCSLKALAWNALRFKANHHLLHFTNGSGWVESFGTSLCTVHDGVTAVERPFIT